MYDPHLQSASKHAASGASILSLVPVSSLHAFFHLGEALARYTGHLGMMQRLEVHFEMVLKIMVAR